MVGSMRLAGSDACGGTIFRVESWGSVDFWARTRSGYERALLFPRVLLLRVGALKHAPEDTTRAFCSFRILSLENLRARIEMDC